MSNAKFELLDGGVTAPQGFKAAGVAAGIKKNGNKDLAVIYSEKPAAAAGVYTTNKVKAAPLLLTQANLQQGRAQAIVVNAGNANACTGEQGAANAWAMAQETAVKCGLEPQAVIVASTGVIGVQLPIAKAVDGIAQAVGKLSSSGGRSAAEAIMTTDTFVKEAALVLELAGKQVTLGAMAKGSGMIHPNMATMLGFVTADVAITAPLLHKALKYATEQSFNMVTVDGDTSTNDMVVMLANGLAGNPVINEENQDYLLFQEALTEICVELAKAIARDGEGATKFIEVSVKNAPTLDDARKAAKAVVSSSLVKTAIFGEDANWGRIIAAVGYSGAEFDPAKVDIYLGSEKTAENGCALDFSEERAKEVLVAKEVIITVDLNAGSAAAIAWGCDLSYDYVKINGSYRT